MIIREKQFRENILLATYAVACFLIIKNVWNASLKKKLKNGAKMVLISYLLELNLEWLNLKNR